MSTEPPASPIRFIPHTPESKAAWEARVAACAGSGKRPPAVYARTRPAPEDAAPKPTADVPAPHVSPPKAKSRKDVPPRRRLRARPGSSPADDLSDLRERIDILREIRPLLKPHPSIAHLLNQLLKP